MPTRNLNSTNRSFKRVFRGTTIWLFLVVIVRAAKPYQSYTDIAQPIVRPISRNNQLHVFRHCPKWENGSKFCNKSFVIGCAWKKLMWMNGCTHVLALLCIIVVSFLLGKAEGRRKFAWNQRTMFVNYVTRNLHCIKEKCRHFKFVLVYFLRRVSFLNILYF